MRVKENPGLASGALEESAADGASAVNATGPKSASSTGGPKLTAAHRELLNARGITDAYVEAHPTYFRSYDAGTVLPESLQWVQGTPGGATGLVIAWRQFGGGLKLQLRPDGDVSIDGRRLKYVGPKRDADDAESVLSYGVPLQSSGADVPVVIAEGSCQHHATAAAFEAAGVEVTVIGIPGVQALSAGITGSLAAADPFRGRVVYIAVDADASGNPAVYDAAVKLGEHVQSIGAKKALYLVVPAVAGPTTGLDDFLASVPVDERADRLRALMGSALTKPAVRRPKTKTSAPKERTEHLCTWGQDVDPDPAYTFPLKVDATTGKWLGYSMGLHPRDVWEHQFDGQGRELRTKVRPDTLAEALLTAFDVALSAAGVLAWYDVEQGRYVEAGVQYDDFFHSLIGRLLGDDYKAGHADVYGRLRGITVQRKRVLWEVPPEPIVNHKGGLLDLRTLVNHPHSPDYLSTQQLAVEIDVDGVCPHYDEWVLGRVGAEQAAVLDALHASALDPSAPSAKAGFLFGTTRTGKSTMLRLIKGVFGEDQTASVGLADLGRNKYAVGALRNKSINLAGEVSASDVSDLTAFKQLTGGDPLFADIKYGPAITFRTNMALLFAGNKIPSVPAEDAFYARMVPVAFPRSYVGREDPEVESRLMAELPAIAGRWARAYGQTIEAHSAVMEFFRGGTDRVAQFLYEATEPCDVEVDPTSSVVPGSVGTSGAATPTQVARAFKEWAETNNTPAMGRNRLVERLQALGVQRLLVGASGNKRALNIRVLDPTDWDMSGFDAASLIPALWPDGEPDDDPEGGCEVPTPPAPTPLQPAESSTSDAAELAVALAAHFDQRLLSEGLFRALVEVSVPGDATTLARDGANGVLLAPPTVLLSEVTAASGISDAYWVRSVIAASQVAMRAIGITVQERRLSVEGDLGSWDRETTGHYTSPADRAALKATANQLKAVVSAARKTKDSAAVSDHECQHRAATLTAAATNGLPSELVGYAVAVDTTLIETTLELNHVDQ